VLGRAARSHASNEFSQYVASAITELRQAGMSWRQIVAELTRHPDDAWRRLDADNSAERAAASSCLITARLYARAVRRTRDGW
jgi:hypothetical protein